MSFQGDVAGLGLGELLQGLARGGREGVLTLHGGGRSCSLGLHGGQIYLIPEPDEDPEMWRRRCERAWVKDPNHRIDALRMQEIAYAARMEALFQELDAPNVHFRFEPQPLTLGELSVDETPLDRDDDLRTDARAKLSAKTPVWCPGIAVEFVLLEFARLTDEAQRHGDSTQLSPDDIPRQQETHTGRRDLEKFWGECDGESTILEIADRLGWPLRQCRAIVQELGAQGFLRLTDARELLGQAQAELARGSALRAAARLSGWVLRAPPGPPEAGDAELLRGEWQAGRLVHVLGAMSAVDARTLLRRIEFGETEVTGSLERWQELKKCHKHDSIADVHLLRLALAHPASEDASISNECLKLARSFQENDSIRRAAVMLRAAADRCPDNLNARLELGARMLSVGMIDEGAPWILDASQKLIEQGNADRAMASIRTVLSAAPESREAKALLLLAKKRSTAGRVRRRNALVALALTGLLAVAALVQLRSAKNEEQSLAHIVARVGDDPELALKMLQSDFADSPSARVADLRAQLEESLLSQEQGQRNLWVEGYRSAQQECAQGDPLVGLRLTIELSRPPEGKRVLESLPTMTELFDQLAARIEQAAADSGKLAGDLTEVARTEKRASRLVHDLLALVDAHRDVAGIAVLAERLAAVEILYAQRDEQRARERVEREQIQRLETQERLLHTARAHAEAGDLERAVLSWRELVDMPDSELLSRAFAGEIRAVEEHYAAWLEARELCSRGDYPAAKKRLAEVCTQLSEHVFAYEVETLPTGSRARFPDGSVRVTPFTLETAFGERVEFVLEHPGYEHEMVTFDAPADRLVSLSRSAARIWQNTLRVEALPVAVGDDHVVCDRSGNIARLAPDGSLVWQRSLETLSGIARSPVFLSRRPGELLVLSEEGRIWTLTADNGNSQGPHALDSAPIDGPLVVGASVRARLSDGREVEWLDSRVPVAQERNVPGSLLHPFGSDAGMAVLRRREKLSHELDSPWSDWSAKILEGRVQVSSPLGDTFCARLVGEWVYIAWEAPNARTKGGRLWVSDGQGLRAFEP